MMTSTRSATSSATPASYFIDVGKAAGHFDFKRNTVDVPEQMVISCADGGTINNASSYTAGCESTGAWVWTLLAMNCSSSRIKVAVAPNCDGSGQTSWDLSLSCGY